MFNKLQLLVLVTCIRYGKCFWPLSGNRSDRIYLETGQHKIFGYPEPFDTLIFRKSYWSWDYSWSGVTSHVKFPFSSWGPINYISAVEVIDELDNAAGYTKVEIERGGGVGPSHKSATFKIRNSEGYSYYNATLTVFVNYPKLTTRKHVVGNQKQTTPVTLKQNTKTVKKATKKKTPKTTTQAWSWWG